MIRFQIVEREGADLYRTLLRAMRSGDLKTFYATKRGRKVHHANESYPGWMSWSHAGGVIHCEVVSPRRPGGEWQLFSAFIGRLAHRFAPLVHSVNIQFPGAVPLDGKPKRRKRRNRR
jgi:hypothetical protein